jgi:low affinity Fe/Cu permease
MNKKYFTKFNVKNKVLRHELARAHGMIVLLVIALMGILAFTSSFDVRLDPILSFSAVLLLALVGVTSLSVVVTLMKKR